MNDPEAPKILTSVATQRGNWITFPFIIGTATCLTVAGAGWVTNVIVFMITEFNVKSIDAAQIFNVINGACNLFPIIGAIIADAFLGNFYVVIISSCVSFLGVVLLALIALLDSLRPEPCGENGSNLCQNPSKLQYAILYGAFVLGCIGYGGSRFTIATMGANLFDKKEDQGIFFNWYFFTLYFSNLLSATAIVYIEDNVSWSLGFGLCVAANFIGIVIFLLGNRFYIRDKPQGSPFTGLARVVVAAIQKRKKVLLLPSTSGEDLLSSTSGENYYYERDIEGTEVPISMTNSFRFLNRAAMKAEGDIKPDGSIARPWRLCTVQQVEDFKTLIRVLPICSTAILLSTPISMQISLTVLQALSMDRHLGKHFEIPAGSITVIVLISACIFITLNDRVLFRFWQKIMRKSPTLFQKIGVGHVLNVLSLTIAALVESRRLKIAHAQHQHKDEASSIVPMLALWLFPQLILVGIGEAFHFPGQVAFYYQEFPASLRSTATAMLTLILAISFYLSTALIDFVRRVTNWLPEDIDYGRLDNVYWVLAVVGLLNFGYYLVCAKLYKHQNPEKAVGESSSGSHN